MNTSIQSFLLLLILALPACAADGNCTVKDPATRPDCPQAIQFFERLQEAVRSDQPARVALLVSYPLRTSIAGKRTLVRSQRQFLSAYTQIFTPAVRCAVLASKKSEVWGNSHGFMIADGAVWWEAIMPTVPAAPAPDSNPGTYPFKVITVNNANGVKLDCPEGEIK
jgi:hypothetical protein